MVSFLSTCLHGGGRPQVGEVTRLGGVTRQSIYSLILIWSRLHDRWGDPPKRVALSAGVKFCHVNVSRWGNPPSRSRTRDTSNSSKIHFSGGFASLLKVKIDCHSTEDCSKSSKWVQKSIKCQNTWFASIFLVYELSDHSIIMRKCTPGWRGCKIVCKRGLFF